MKQTIRLTESELRRMIFESVRDIMNENDNDWSKFEKGNTIKVGNRDYDEKKYKAYRKNKKDGETYDSYHERVKKEKADKRAATKAEKAERAEAKKLGMTLKKYRQHKNGDNVEKAVAESIRKYINML